jgi:hypothetical protein
MTEFEAGYEEIVASTYPLQGETQTDSEQQGDVAAGPAKLRVESNCPAWSFTVSPVAQ